VGEPFRVYNQLAISERQASYDALAEDAARQALALQPQNAQAWNNLAVALNAQGRRAEAVQALRTAEADAPGNPQVEANLRALTGAP
jgi:Flp pilus assembly protein TadD